MQRSFQQVPAGHCELRQQHHNAMSIQLYCGPIQVQVYQGAFVLRFVVRSALHQRKSYWILPTPVTCQDAGCCGNLQASKAHAYGAVSLPVQKQDMDDEQHLLLYGSVGSGSTGTATTIQ